jgi:peptide-methionine (S)-S-oxide reductase
MSASTAEKATFAAGCFWGVEHIFNKHLKKDGITTRVGYIGGDLADPNYQQVRKQYFGWVKKKTRY